MIIFLINKSKCEEIEILVDEKGVEELISYLKFIKDTNDHMHLLIGCEIDPIKLPSNIDVEYAKFVTLRFCDKSCWGEEE